MKTRILTVSLMLMAIILFSCKKDKEEQASNQEVSFEATQIKPDGGKKSTSTFDVQCSETEPSNAHIVIDGVPYDPSVYRVDGILYTQAIKLAPESYTVTQFFLYKDLGTPGYDAADLIIMATPEEGSPYAVYTTPALPYDFTVSAFAKAQVPMQVLCFKPEAYIDFGFGWFTIGEVILREANFFGDICIANPALYAGSIYATNGVNVDEVAVTQVIVKRNDVEVPNSPFNNMASYGAAAPLKVQYPDYVGQVDNYTFELQVWVPSATPGIFAWQTYDILNTTDATPLSGIGMQGVFDYAIGTCSPNSTNIYTWLAPLVVPPVVTAGFVSGGTKKGNARWRNLRLDGRGWELAVGQNIPTSNWTSQDFNYDYDYYFSSETTTPNLVTYTYNAITGDQTIEAVVNGGTVTTTKNNGNLGTINYMQWQVNGDPGKTLEFNNVQLTVGGQTYNLGSFETEYGDWYINYDLTSGFSLTGEMVINGQATGDEGMKLEISAKEF